MNEKIKHILSKDGFHWLIYYALLATKTARFVPDKWYVELEYHCLLGKRLNLKHPVTYAEKLQWIKLYDRNPLYTIMVDKYKVKQYVSNVIGNQYVVPLIGVWDKPEDIDWEILPRQFVLKTNHDCGGLVICKDKSNLDRETTVKKLNKSLSHDYWLAGREWPYKNIPRKIIAEQYIEDSTGGLVDYKVMCFNGEPKLIQVHVGRFTNLHSEVFYDTCWNKTNIMQASYGVIPDVHVEKPVCLPVMLELSEKLSVNIPHVRVDWYIVDNRLYLGELTFFDASGFDPFCSTGDEERLGSWINLSSAYYYQHKSLKK